jgi:NADH:ubiquinone oxidoreductase subunit 6 (subunit J)
MLMSITMFVLGVTFLVIAAIRTLTDPDSVQVNGVIAGIGVVQIALLFYRNPVRDIARSIANSQQGQIVVLSYFLGMSLIAKSLEGTATDKEQQALSAFTQQALDQLDRLTDGKLEQKALGHAAEPATDAG